jgi:hypothetical protein
MHLTMTIQQAGLTAGASYALSLKATGPDGHGANIGTGDQQADANGRVLFDVEFLLLQAVARAGYPCSVDLWVRAGGSPFGAPPPKPGAHMTVTVP